MSAATSNTRHGWSALGAGAVAAALLGAELGAGALVAAGLAPAAAALHVAASAGAFALAWRRDAAALPAATLRMATLLAPFLGPLAPAAALVILGLHAGRRDPEADAEMWHEHLFPHLAADPVADRVEEMGRRSSSSDGAGEVASFRDVLRWGTLAEKEHVLTLVGRSFRPEFAPVLREALTGDDLGLRAQAAAGLALIEARLAARIGELREAHLHADEDYDRDSVAVALAHALGEGAHSGLYDEIQTCEMRREMSELLAPVFGARADDAALGATLGRTLIQLGELDRAVEMLEIAVEGGPYTEAAFTWLVEALFRRGDFSRLAALLARRRSQAAALVELDGPLAPALAFWAEAA